MDKRYVKRFLEENNIKYYENNRGGFTDFYLEDYSKIYSINCYYDNCEIIVKGDNDIEHYNCNKYLRLDFLEDYK